MTFVNGYRSENPDSANKAKVFSLSQKGDSATNLDHEVRYSGRWSRHASHCCLANQKAFCTLRNHRRIKNNHQHENSPDFAVPSVWQ